MTLEIHLKSLTPKKLGDDYYNRITYGSITFQLTTSKKKKHLESILQFYNQEGKRLFPSQIIFFKNQERISNDKLCQIHSEVLNNLLPKEIWKAINLKEKDEKPGYKTENLTISELVKRNYLHKINRVLKKLTPAGTKIELNLYSTFPPLFITNIDLERVYSKTNKSLKIEELNLEVVEKLLDKLIEKIISIKGYE